MPLTKKGASILRSMEKTYPNKEKAEQVFYASRNAGKITGVDSNSKLDAAVASCDSFEKRRKR